MAVIEPRKTSEGVVRWRAKVRLHGQTHSGTFDRKTDARDWAQRIESEIKRGVALGQPIIKKHTLNEAVVAYVAFKGHSAKVRQLDTRTRLLKWWQQELGLYYMSDITVEVLTICKGKLLNAHTQNGGEQRKLSPATVQSYLMAMSALLTFAQKELHWILTNPMQDVPKPKFSNEKVRWLNADERGLLMNACRHPDRHPLLYPFVLVAVSTGMRRGEIEALRWEWIDFKRGLISVPHTKNGDSRSVPLTGKAHATLLEMSKIRRLSTSLVFANAMGTKHQLLECQWRAARKASTVMNFRFHDLRHTAATYMLQSGASLVELSALLGHRNIQMVKRYAHLSQNHAHDLVTKMNQMFLNDADAA